MNPVLASALASPRCAAALERWRRVAERGGTLEAFVDSLLRHVNEMAHALDALEGRQTRGQVFRIGIAFVTEDELVVPLPFRATGGASLFFDEFHAMPLRATSLGPLLAGGVGDRIDDMEQHLLRRGVSLSSQVALREGVRSNLRLPWRSLDRRGLLWFSADRPRFFSDLLFEYCASLVPLVERQLRLLDGVPLLRPRTALEDDPGRLARLLGLLQVAENPLPARLRVSAALPAGDDPPGAGRLINLWRLDERRVLLLAIQAPGTGGEYLRRILWLRGLFLQHSATLRSPALVLEAVERELRTARAEGRLDGGGDEGLALCFARLDVDGPLLDWVAVGGPLLWLLAPGRDPRPLVGPADFGRAESRSATALALAGGSQLLLVPPAGPWNAAAVALRLAAVQAQARDAADLGARLAASTAPAPWPGHLQIGLREPR
jgi:hypothetical protein